MGLPDPTKPLGRSSDLSRIFGWASQSLPDHFVASRLFPDLRVGLLNLQVSLLTSPKPLAGPLDPTQIFGWSSLALLNLRVGLPTPPEPTGGPPNLSRISGWAT